MNAIVLIAILSIRDVMGIDAGKEVVVFIEKNEI